MSQFHLLTTSNPKFTKCRAYGYLTAGLHLAPGDLSGLEVCPWRSPGCTAACLNLAGRGRMQPIQDARIRKTRMLFERREHFLELLDLDLFALERKAKRMGLKCACRLNATSDLIWLDQYAAPRHPGIQFYGYTKCPRPHRLISAPNQHYTFSLSETNLMDAIVAINLGTNVAAVFDTPKGGILPSKWMGSFPIVDGDRHDLTFLYPPGTCLGLRAKGPAIKDVTGFVQHPLVQIKEAA